MERELPEDEREDELTREAAQPESALEAASGEPIVQDSGNIREDAAEAPGEVVSGIVSDATPDFPAKLPDEPIAPDSLASLVGESAPAETEPPDDPPPAKPSGTDWSNFVPAPGYADPKTGKPRFLTGRVNQAGLDLSDFVYGRRPVFEPEVAQPGEESPPQPPWFARSQGEGGPPSLYAQREAAGASAPVFVEVRVSMSPEEIQRVSKESIRKAAEFSRGETMIVARKLLDLTNEVKMREIQRRIQARDY
jgi:hypothetical protein